MNGVKVYGWMQLALQQLWATLYLEHFHHSAISVSFFTVLSKDYPLSISAGCRSGFSSSSSEPCVVRVCNPTVYSVLCPLLILLDFKRYPD